MRLLRSPAARRCLYAILLLAVPACKGTRGNRYPATRTVAVVDTLHGAAIPDPYRWLEDQDGEEVRAWILAQERFADSVMGPATPLRDSLRQRLGELLDVPATGVPRKAGAHEYFTLRRKGEPVAAIYRRPAPAAPAPVAPDSQYEKVIDPLTIRDDGTTSVAIEGFSADGRLMLWSVRDGGPDEVRVKVRNLVTGADLPDSMPPALYASLAITPDAAGMTYVLRSRQLGPRYKLHRFGTPFASDSTLFGEGYAPTAFLQAALANGGKQRIYTVAHGWARNEVHVQDTRTGAIIDITKGLNAHFAAQPVNGRLFVRTDRGAPRGKVVAVDLAHPEPGRWTDVIAEGPDVLDGFAEIDGRLYVTWIHDVGHRITVHALDGTLRDSVALPPHVTATIRSAGKGEALLTVSSFSHPATTWRVNLATGARTVWEASTIPWDTAGVEVRQVWYSSKDGTRVPMYLMQRRGAARSPSTPALMSGYGGFAQSLLPRFDARAALWVERGGLWAQPSLRGGNELGEAWHQGGMLTNKQNVFDDFTFAGQYLVDSGYTSPAHLAIRGVSNAGLLMGAALTQRPDLYRAAFVGLPDLDMVRFYTFTSANNMPALLEYGDASKRAEFEAIVKYSPYQNVMDGTKYPAIMVQTGMNDTRVPPWQARKFAARLQAATRSGEPVIHYHDLRSGHAGGRSMAGTIDLALKEVEFLWSRAR